MFTSVLMFLIVVTAYSQDDMAKVMEKRAREFHRVMTLDDKAKAIAFIKENYSQALIDKPMRAEKQTSENDNKSSESKTVNNAEAKAEMFKQLFQDFGTSKILSLKQDGDKVVMQVQGNGMTGDFTLRFQKTSPYLIDGLGIEVNAGN